MACNLGRDLSMWKCELNYYQFDGGKSSFTSESAKGVAVLNYKSDPAPSSGWEEQMYGRRMLVGRVRGR